jgi:hypothetical protein
MTVPVPMDRPPSRNVTVPLLAGLLPFATAAVKITLEPNAGLAVDVLSIVVVASSDTDTATAAEVEGANVNVPAKLAVIEFTPIGSVVRFNVATPLMTTPVPIDVPPLRNVTIPLVAGLLPFATAAVKITLEPNAGLVVDALSVVEVWSGLSVTMTTLEVEAAKFDVPVKETVIEFEPTGNVVRLMVPTPL